LRNDWGLLKISVGSRDALGSDGHDSPGAALGESERDVPRLERS
jgi:hypothetical protein